MVRFVNNNFLDLFKTIINPEIETMYDEVKSFKENNKDSFCKRICNYTLQDNKVGVGSSLQLLYTLNMKKLFAIKLLEENSGIRDGTEENVWKEEK